MVRQYILLNVCIEIFRMELVKDSQGLEATLEFSWSHLEHAIDSVRHNTKVQDYIDIG